MDQDITRLVPFVSQIDGRWNNLVMMRGYAPQDIDKVPVYGVCGCFLSALSSVLQAMAPVRGDGSLPRFATGLIVKGTTTVDPVTGVATNLVPSSDLTPVYIDHFLRCGTGPDRTQTETGPDPCNDPLADVNWGYKIPSADDGKSCGVQIWPNSLEEAVISRTYSDGNGGIYHTPTGMALKYSTLDKGLDAAAKTIIYNNLKRNVPTIVITKVWDPRDPSHNTLLASQHAYVVVGYKAADDQFLAYDPGNEADVPRPDQPQFSLHTGNYNGWEQDAVGLIVPKVTTGESHLSIGDDPAPIEFGVTSPAGQYSGYDPATGLHVSNAENASSFSLATDENLLGADTTPQYEQMLDVDNPEDGLWRAEVIGTGSGPFKADIDTADGGVRIVVQTLSGTISPGQVLKYEIQYKSGKPPSVTPVADFRPQAVPGDSRDVRTGQSITFDGKRSWDADGTVVAWNWDFGDGTQASGSRQTHSYATRGTYTVKLTVTDDSGSTDMQQLQVAVTAAPTIDVQRVSLSTEGLQGNDASAMTLSTAGWSDGGDNNWIETTALSRDGRYTAFQSVASDLVAGDTNSAADIFLHDNQSGATTRISLASDGSQLSGPSGVPRLSADGSYAIFRNEGSVYLWSRSTSRTELVSLDTSGNAQSGKPDIPGSVSPDGRYVVFSTTAGLDPTDTNGNPSIYLRDRQTGTTTWISRGVESSTYGAWDPVASDDASRIAFTTADSSGSQQIYLYEAATGTARLVSTDDAGNALTSAAMHADITPDGRYIVFSNDSLGAATPGGARVVEKDLATGKLQAVPGSANVDNGALISRARLSADGQRILVLVPSRLPNPFGNPFQAQGFGVYERSTGRMTRIDLTQSGALGDQAGSPYAAMSGDGRYVAFSSYASKLVPFDTNGQPDVFLRDTTTLVPPTADTSGPYAGWASAGNDGLIVTFDGSGSADASGASLSYVWDFGDGTVVTTPNKTTAHSYGSAGSYTATLMVDNGETSSAPATTSVTIYPQPDITPSVAPTCMNTGDSAAITGTATIPLAARKGWNFINGQLPDTQNALFGDWGQRFDYTAKAPTYKYAIQASITAGTGAHSISGTAITVPCSVPPSMPPIPNAGGPYTTQVGVPVVFDGSHSTDPRNAVLTYSWNFDDQGSTGTGANPSHTYTQPGTYFVGLTVSDGTYTISPSAGFGYAKVIVTRPTVTVHLTVDQSKVSAPEGSTAKNTGTYSIAPGDTLSLTSSIGRLNDLGNGKWEWSGTTPDAPTSTTVTISATTLSGATDKVQFELDSTIVNPVIDSIQATTPTVACQHNNVVTLNIAAHDPADGSDPLAGSVAWGDGTTSSLSGTSSTLTHSYQPGDYTATAQLRDDDGGTATATTEVKVLYATGDLEPPIKSDGTSEFHLGSTIPVKVTIKDCNGDPVLGLNPTVGLSLTGRSNGDVAVASSDPTVKGNIMRPSGVTYIYNLSTKVSQFEAGGGLVPGKYLLTVGSPVSTQRAVFIELDQ